ncbi:hypothetical protein JHK82_034169 [Glycine max]|nr:hypothetical protein JHK85_034881 [Glycine max]KAG5119749.1 hypothetical protein JHK82_034169 [Glycine max]KAG5140738.1 hypothetical protein JHK84_034506 [Glycine max]
MNAPIIDPLQGDFPEVIEEYLEHGCMKCIAFNRRGTLLAAGCNNGSCVIWDFETRGIAKELQDDECSSPITSVCWSKCGNRILVSAADKSLLLWDVMSVSLPLPLVSLHHATAPQFHLATAAFTSFDTTSPRYIKQHAMYLPWRGSHLAIMEDGSKALLVISATESCSCAPSNLNEAVRDEITWETRRLRLV